VEEPLERGALHVARGAAGRGVAQTVAHLAQLADARVELVGLGRELRAIDPGMAVGTEHGADLVEGEAGGAPEADEREPLEHVGGEETEEPAPPDGRDEPLFLVEAQGRRGDAGRARDLANVEDCFSGHAP
jgi:hypothetical protein